MKSPITGNDMILQKEERTLSFRNEKIKISYHFYLCVDSKERFENDYLAHLNIIQVYNKYRERLKLPFADEISAIKDKYNLSARKMSDILGFGPNTYSNYEKGEIPSKANARLIQLAEEPDELFRLANYSNNLTEKLKIKITELQNSSNSIWNIESFFKENTQSSINGYKMFTQDKAYQMVLFFAESIQPWKTKLNKLLFYSDFLHFKNYGYSISGLKYAAIDYGPVPDEYEILFTFGRQNKIFKKQNVDINNEVSGEKIVPMHDSIFNNGFFDEKELETLNVVLNNFRYVSSTDIVKMSHKEKAWIDNYKQNKYIDYKYSFDLIYV